MQAWVACLGPQADQGEDRPSVEGGAERKGWVWRGGGGVPEQRAAGLLHQSSTLPRGQTSSCCSGPIDFWPSACPSPERLPKPGARRAWLWSDPSGCARSRSAPLENTGTELQSAKCTPASPCTCPAARQPWPMGASLSLATCSVARAGVPRACTASRPSWALPRTTGS